MSRLIPAVARATIITLDDEADILDLMNTVLRRAGFEVHGACSFDELSMYLNDMRCDAIVLDIRISDGHDGFWIAETLRGRGIQIPIIFVTAFDAPATRLRASLIPHSHFLLKPFDPQELIDSILLAIRVTVL